MGKGSAAETQEETAVTGHGMEPGHSSVFQTLALDKQTTARKSFIVNLGLSSSNWEIKSNQMQCKFAEPLRLVTPL